MIMFVDTEKKLYKFTYLLKPLKQWVLNKSYNIYFKILKLKIQTYVLWNFIIPMFAVVWST